MNCDEKTIKRPKGGAEKARLKRSLGIIAAGNDPKQKKICFSTAKPLATLPTSIASSLSTSIDDLNDNSFDTNVTNICQTVIVDQSYPSNVDTRSKIPDKRCRITKLF
ncbi:hypothetical protein QTP88_007364 [Uroleucon formosanum]